MSIYKYAIKNLIVFCENYKKQKIDLEVLEAFISNTAHEIVAVEEKELRNFLFDYEWKLEKIRFLCDEDKTFEATLKIVDEIEARLLKEL